MFECIRSVIRYCWRDPQLNHHHLHHETNRTRYTTNNRDRFSIRKNLFESNTIVLLQIFSLISIDNSSLSIFNRNVMIVAAAHNHHDHLSTSSSSSAELISTFKTISSPPSSKSKMNKTVSGIENVVDNIRSNQTDGFESIHQYSSQRFNRKNNHCPFFISFLLVFSSFLILFSLETSQSISISILSQFYSRAVSHSDRNYSLHYIRFELFLSYKIYYLTSYFFLFCSFL